MANFDTFAALASGVPVTIHNVQLVNVQPDGNGKTVLTIEHSGTRHEVMGNGTYGEVCHDDVGKFGYVEPALPFGLADRVIPVGTCYFRAYVDQSLRRVPELDLSFPTRNGNGRTREVIGWCCNARPSGFRAPLGIIPGEAGRFVPDETEEVSLRVPPEFIRECARVQMNPEELLRSFVGDLAGIQNLSVCPRADRFGSNGSDERMFAQQWLDRAHGLQAIDLHALSVREADAEEKQFNYDELTGLLDEYEYNGGKADELLAAIQALVDRQV